AVALQDHLVRSLSLNDPLNNRKSYVSPKKSTRKTKAVSKIDTGVKKPTPKKTLNTASHEKEYVIESRSKPLTLAQKFGIIDTPNKPLTEEEWARLKDKSNERQDSSLPCPICQEHFGNQQQILLSCSHVFHRTCLESYEKFSGRKTCPMCRKVEYQKRVIYEGSKINRVKCAIKIQSAWRGYVVRKWYANLRRTMPPKNPLLRQKFFQAKLAEITDTLVSSVNTDVDAFLADIDSSVAASRQIMSLADTSYDARLNENEWKKIQVQALRRSTLECPICIAPIEKPRASTSKSKNGNSKQLVILSCSHIFHQVCLEAFEEFSIQATKVCPVCRSHYVKRKLDLAAIAN
ncbi:uncharacterized protein TRIADDRAFT_20747, partial [Trichoplax adhaerens]